MSKPESADYDVQHGSVHSKQLVIGGAPLTRDHRGRNETDKRAARYLGFDLRPNPGTFREGRVWHLRPLLYDLKYTSVSTVHSYNRCLRFTF